jgi:hypothetical protein
MKRQIYFVNVKIEPTEFPILNGEEEREYRDRVTKEIQAKFPDNDIEIRFAWKSIK